MKPIAQLLRWAFLQAAHRVKHFFICVLWHGGHAWKEDVRDAGVGSERHLIDSNIVQPYYSYTRVRRTAHYHVCDRGDCRKKVFDRIEHSPYHDPDDRAQWI